MSIKQVGCSRSYNTRYAMGGPYEWEYERQEAGWRLKRQRLGVWWTQGQDVISAFDGA